MCASHNGEQYHVESVQSMLAKFGAGPDNLSCGIHPPFHKATAEAMTKQQASFTTLHNNCSGKHAGMVALARVLGVSIVDYANPQHPVQVEMKQVIAEMTELDATEIQLGTDGCGVPVFGLPLAKLAYAYAKLGTGHSCSQVRKMSCELILQAMVNYPEYVAGEDRYDTRLILATNGRIIGKMGAEAVFALTIPSEKIGIAIKIEDGNFRALYPTVTETLHQLGYITDNE
jgi:L-asparaginase II